MFNSRHQPLLLIGNFWTSCHFYIRFCPFLEAFDPENMIGWSMIGARALDHTDVFFPEAPVHIFMGFRNATLSKSRSCTQLSDQLLRLTLFTRSPGLKKAFVRWRDFSFRFKILLMKSRYSSTTEEQIKSITKAKRFFKAVINKRNLRRYCATSILVFYSYQLVYHILTRDGLL